MSRDDTAAREAVNRSNARAAAARKIAGDAILEALRDIGPEERYTPAWQDAIGRLGDAYERLEAGPRPGTPDALLEWAYGRARAALPGRPI